MSDSPEQKLIELAKWFEVPYRTADRQWCLQEAEMLRTVAAELAELREKAEALEWIIKKGHFNYDSYNGKYFEFTARISAMDSLNSFNQKLRQMIEQKERT